MKKRIRAFWAWFLRCWARLAALLGDRRVPPEATPAEREIDEPALGEGCLRVVFVEDEPDELKRDVLYAVGENGYLWQATFACPCGCQARITLNLLPDDSPRWQLHVVAGVPTLTPSIWRKAGCRSHFFIRQGRVDWCSAGHHPGDRGSTSRGAASPTSG